MSDELTRDEVNRLPGLVVLEFGASWCPHCIAIEPMMSQSLARHPHIRHIAIEDGRGKPLGRSFRVKLWPTLVLLRDGHVVRQLVRPATGEISAAMTELAGDSSQSPGEP
jgi:thioredoxin 1